MEWTLNELVKLYREIKDEYAWKPDVMSEDGETVDALKRIINTRLSSADKTLFVLYAHFGGYRPLAEAIGVSHMSIGREIRRIKERILEEYGNICGNGNSVGGDGIHR